MAQWREPVLEGLQNKLRRREQASHSHQRCCPSSFFVQQCQFRPVQWCIFFFCLYQRGQQGDARRFSGTLCISRQLCVLPPSCRVQLPVGWRQLGVGSSCSSGPQTEAGSSLGTQFYTSSSFLDTICQNTEPYSYSQVLTCEQSVSM